jgi:hypothetical protein
MALKNSRHSILVKLLLSKITKGRRLALPALCFFEAFSRSWRSYTPRPTPLAGTQGRTRRSCSRAESHSRHQRRRHVPQLFAARRATIGAGGLGPHPIPLHFTSWIDTPNGGARHHGHSELPQRPPTHSAEVSPFGGQKFAERTERTCEFSRRAFVASTENDPNTLYVRKYLWKNASGSDLSSPNSTRLVTLSHPPNSRKEFPFSYVVEVRTAKFQYSTLNGGSYAK